MKPASAALQALLASRKFFAADLYTFTLVGGQVLRYCGGDKDLSANGNSYTAGGSTGPFFDRKDNKAKCHWKLGVEVDTLTFDVLPGSATVLGENFLSAIHNGLFDGAELQLERAFMSTYGSTAAGTVILFVGRIAEIDAGRQVATFTINSHLELLNQNLPRNLFQAPCINNLGDAACGVNLPSFAAVGNTVQAGSTAVTLVTASAGAAAAGYFTLGKVVFTSGQNNALSRTVIGYVPGTWQLVSPLPFTPAVGDTFTAYPGCDKTLGPQGCPKFNNVPRFRGFPFVPVPETAL